LKLFIEELDEEEKRGVREGLNGEKLDIFDLLSQAIQLSEKERAEVKAIARLLPEKIRDDLVIDSRKKQQATARVRGHFQDVMDSLPDSYDSITWSNVFDAVYQHVYQAYRGKSESVYH
jgi:type I restriction enzyme R subunit